MARIIPYDQVVQTMLGQGFTSLYHNSGSFGFSRGTEKYVQGWIGPPDPTIRPEARGFTRHVAEPFVDNLVQHVREIRANVLNGVVWVMPASHWAFELDFGSQIWLPSALAAIRVDAGELVHLTNGTAIAFEPGEANEFDSFLHHLLDNLSGSSDFQLAWPGKPVLCTVHHHKQLWWTTSDEQSFRAIDAVMK